MNLNKVRHDVTEKELFSIVDHCSIVNRFKTDYV